MDAEGISLLEFPGDQEGYSVGQEREGHPAHDDCGDNQSSDESHEDVEDGFGETHTTGHLGHVFGESGVVLN